MQTENLTVTQEIIDRLQKVVLAKPDGNYIKLNHSRLSFFVEYKILKPKLGRKTISLSEENGTKWKNKMAKIAKRGNDFVLYLDEFEYSIKF